jgi:hypothetical protein
MKPYIPHLLHTLNDDGPGIRIKFCEWFLNVQAGNLEFTTKILRMDKVTSNQNGRLRKDKLVYFCNKTQIVLQKKSLIFMSKSAGRICAAGMIGPCYVASIVMQTFAWNVCRAQRSRRVTSTVN